MFETGQTRIERSNKNKQLHVDNPGRTEIDKQLRNLSWNKSNCVSTFDDRATIHTLIKIHTFVYIYL